MGGVWHYDLEFELVRYVPKSILHLPYFFKTKPAVQ